MTNHGETVEVPSTQDQYRSDPRPRSARKRGGWVLAVLAVSQLMIVLDGTVVNIALPRAQHDLGFGTDQRQWIVVAYSLAFGGLLLLGGRLTDLFGRKRVFLIGLIGFAVASVVAGAAPDLAALISGRAAQGVFAALLAPASLGLLTVNFTEPNERARAFGVFGAVSGAGAAVGLVLGGALTEYASWRWCLLINVAFATFAVVGAAVTISDVRAPVGRPRLDVLGAVTASLGLVGVVSGLTSAGSNGWGDPTTLLTLAAGVLLLLAFVFVESRVRQPLLPLRVLADRNRVGAYVAGALLSLSLFSVFLFLTYYLQTVRGYTPVQTGVAFLPLPFSIALTAIVIAPRTLQRFGPKVLLVAGPLITAGALLVLSLIDVSSNYWTTVAPGLVLVGIGAAHVFTAAPNIATAGLDPRDVGVGSALVNTAQQVGGSLGVALLSTIALTAVSDYLHDHGRSAVTSAAAQIASYHAAYLTSAGILGLLAITMLLVLRRTGTRTR